MNENVSKMNIPQDERIDRTGKPRQTERAQQTGDEAADEAAAALVTAPCSFWIKYAETPSILNVTESKSMLRGNGSVFSFCCGCYGYPLNSTHHLLVKNALAEGQLSRCATKTAPTKTEKNRDKRPFSHWWYSRNSIPDYNMISLTQKQKKMFKV